MYSNSKSFWVFAFLVAFPQLHIIHLVCGTSDPNDNINENASEVPGEPLSPSDFKNAERITQVDPINPAEDPIEMAGLFEGDIRISERDQDQSSTRNAITDQNKKWPNALVPYLISSRFDEQERSVIARGILEFHRQTCVTFTSRRNENDYVMFSKGKGCSSSVGRVGGIQYVTLGEGCLHPGVVMHEILHAVGFWHEQSRIDRDEHVSVVFENIEPGMEDNFRKVSRGEAQNLSVPYDTSSVMHYGPYAFSRNRQGGLRTIVAKMQNDRMGQRGNFSEMDVLKINKLYNCYRRPTNESYSTTTRPPSTTSTPSPDQGNTQCTDSDKNCEKWAATGECEKNPDWMSTHCKRSCNKCPNSNCTNNSQHCEAWASKGECSKNPEYMSKNCKRACKRC